MQDGSERSLFQIVLDAEGVSSRLLRQAGLKALKPSGLVYAVEAEVDNVRMLSLTRLKFILAKLMHLAFMVGLFQDRWLSKSWFSNKPWRPTRIPQAAYV